MSRYTGPSYKKSRRLGFSTLENGKEVSKWINVLKIFYELNNK